MRMKNNLIKILCALFLIFAGGFVAAYCVMEHVYDRKSSNASKTLYSSVPSIKSAVSVPGAQIPSLRDTASETGADDYIRDTNHQNTDIISVLNPSDGNIYDMPLEDYVASVIVAEMPADSPSEALKSQAVACRTLAVKLIYDNNKSAHKGADICTDPGHCQSFTDKKSFIEKNGIAGENLFAKAENAALATKGIIMLYKGDPIIAAFHASSGEYTASSKEAWGGNVSYLISVKSFESEDQKLYDKINDTKSFTRSEFTSALTRAGITDAEENAALPFHKWISDIKRTESGRIESLKIGNTVVDGKSMRAILGLKSSDFTVTFSEDSIRFDTVGYGHGVGMSQLGAVSMADSGSGFYEILMHYYHGIYFGVV